MNAHLLAIFYLLSAAHASYIFARSNRCNKVAIPNGSMTLKHRGRVAKFTCNSGYRLIGDRISTCHSRVWDEIPVCVKDVKCPDQLPKVINGKMIEHQFIYFKVICNMGYKISDSESVFPCELFYNPNMKTPVCQLAEGNFCDFENGMCRWINTDTTFSFPWILYQNETPSHSLHTGPSGDHTTGLGHYLYIETSGVSEERFAKLTRQFSPVESPEVCFVFWYHMYGHTMGTLDVYVDYNKVFTKFGNLGDTWRRGIIRNLPSERSFLVSVVATSGSGYAGDIAIDDIGLVNSTECSKIPLIETSCRNRCFETERNATLCKCSSECLSESTCCPDFTSVCSFESSTSVEAADVTTGTVTDTTTNAGLEMSTSEADYINVAESLGATESSVFPTGSSGIEVFESTYSTVDSTEYYRTESSRKDYQHGIIKITELPRSRLTSAQLGISKTTSNTDVTLETKMNKISSTTLTMDASTLAESPSNLNTTSKFENNSSTEEPETSVLSTVKPSPDVLNNITEPREPIIEHTSSDPIHFEPLKTETKIAEVITSIPNPANLPSETHYTPPHIQTMSTVQSTSHTSTVVVVDTTQSETHSTSNESGLRTNNLNVETTTEANHRGWSTVWHKVLTDPTLRPLMRHEVSFDDYYDVVEERVEQSPTVAGTHLAVENVASNKKDVPSGGYKWKRTYVPKGHYTFSAVKSEYRSTTYFSIISIISGVLLFSTAIGAAVYLFRRRRQLNRFHDNTEESDVLYLTSDDVLDFNVATRNHRLTSEQQTQGLRHMPPNQPSINDFL